MDNSSAEEELPPTTHDDVDDDLSPLLLQSNNHKERKRNLLSFWIIGLCNNFGYVVMLSAAFDIIKDGGNQNKIKPKGNESHHLHLHSFETSHKNVTGFHCNSISTGVILLADILPTLFIKFTAPFYMQRLNYHVRIAFVILTLMVSLLVLAFSHTTGVSVLAVVLASVSSGFGEITFLSFTSHFRKSAVSAWSSGTGMSGVTGAVAYAGLLQAGLSKRNAVLFLLIVPVIWALAVWGLLKFPQRERLSVQPTTPVEGNDFSKMSLSYKLKHVLSLKKYMIPLFLVYFAEYLINQGLYELLYYNVSWLTQAQQYRWFQVDYQIAVFIARSSVYIVRIRKVHLIAVLQWLVFVFLLLEVRYTFTPYMWITLGVVFVEGLLGGAVYVNTFFRMSVEVEEDRREFSLGAASVGDSFGITIAALVAIPLHNSLCKAKM